MSIGKVIKVNLNNSAKQREEVFWFQGRRRRGEEGKVPEDATTATSTEQGN